MPEQLEQYTTKKLYLHATNTLCESLSLLRNDLRDVTALKDVAVTLAEWKQVPLLLFIIIHFYMVMLILFYIPTFGGALLLHVVNDMV